MSMNLSPIYDDSSVPTKQKPTTTNGKSSNLQLSSSDERDVDFLGSEEKEIEEIEDDQNAKERENRNDKQTFVKEVNSPLFITDKYG